MEQKTRVATSDPNTPLPGVGGVDIVREKPHTRSVGASLVFRSETKKTANSCLLLFDTMTRTKRPQTPLPGVGGVNIIREK